MFHDIGTVRRTACNSEAPNSAVFHVATASNLPFWLQSRRCKRPGKLRRRRECQGGRRRPGGGQGPGEPARQWQQRCHVMSIFDIRPFCAFRAALSVHVFRYDDRNTARRKTEIYTGYATQWLARPKHTAARSSLDLPHCGAPAPPRRTGSRCSRPGKNRRRLLRRERLGRNGTVGRVPGCRPRFSG